MTDTRLNLARAYETASASTIGIELGVWAGRGDWVTCSREHREQAGRRALADLDAQIARLTAFREKLAAEVAPKPADVKPVAVEYGVFTHDGSQLLSGGHANPAQALSHAKPGRIIGVVCPHRSEPLQPAAMCPTCHAETPRLASSTTVVPDDTPLNLTITTAEGQP